MDPSLLQGRTLGYLWGLFVCDLIRAKNCSPLRWWAVASDKGLEKKSSAVADEVVVVVQRSRTSEIAV